MYSHSIIHTRWVAPVLLLLGLALPQAGARADTGAAAAPEDPLLIPGEERLYEREYPGTGYATTPPQDPVSRLARALAQGDRALDFEADRGGYLPGLLEALGIDVASQVLVYSKTSINAAFITARTPRAIYYNDEAYVAWVPGSGEIEVAAMDADLGPVFYNLEQDPATAGLDRQGSQCLRCHDSYSMTGGGVPRFILGSGYTHESGNLVSHEGWILTSPQTPLRFRWGGWYVTGSHGDQVHLGNIVVRNTAELYDLEAIRKGNLEALDGLVDTGRYLSPHSDIVALLVLEHQVHLQNLLTRVNYDTRAALERNEDEASPAGGRIAGIVEPLVEAMLMSGELPLSAPVSGTSGFSASFEQHGPRDALGRSLRELDLKTRVFRYPLSYLVYSAAFERLPDPARQRVLNRLAEILSGADSGPAYAHLSDGDRRAVLEILRDTHPGFREILAGRK